MDLCFGTHVREYGQRAGKLAGFEVDAATRRAVRVVFSTDGELGAHAMTRPFSSLLAEPGEIDIRPYTPVDDAPPAAAVLLSHATRIRSAGREVGRLVGIDVDLASGDIRAIIGRRNWWSRRFVVESASTDMSQAGEIRVGAPNSRAA
jgi:hypothetical protein